MQINDWMALRSAGLYCSVGDFYIDPHRPVARALITHAHADHARAGHGCVWATAQTIDVMKIRYGDNCAKNFVPVDYSSKWDLGSVGVTFFPAGHILGSAQILLCYAGIRLVITGDFKRQLDPTCVPFEVVPADCLITEATFGLPVFRHPPIQQELQKLLDSLASHPKSTHLLGCYALGKAQRVIMGLRALGYQETIYTHGAMQKICDYYQSQGFDLGPLEPVGRKPKKDLVGSLVLAPPSALTDRWAQAFSDVIPAMASGWLSIRARARQRRVELPLVISDHADWHDLLNTIEEVAPKQVFVTHGREDALVYHCRAQGYQAEALHILRDGEEN